MTQEKKLYVSTRNPHKLEELRAILSAIGPFELMSAAEAGVPEVEETGESFLDNAVLKAAAAFRLTSGMSLADDSGLVVDALDGAPGIYSARFAGENADSKANNAHLLERMRGVEPANRGAAFVCQLALIVPESLVRPGLDLALQEHRWVPEGGVLFAIQGRVDGRILEERCGSGGFGYDPLFHYEPAGLTLAEMDADFKNTISHRGRALAQLASCLTQLIEV